MARPAPVEPKVAKTIKLTPSLWLAIQAEAQRQNRSMTNYIENLIKEAIANG